MKIFLIFAVIMIATCVTSYAQPCEDPNDPCSTQWIDNPSNPVRYEVAPGCFVEVNIQFRNCGTNFQYRYDILPGFLPLPDNNCSFLGISNPSTELERFVDLQATQFIGATVPSCASGTAKIVKYDITPCTFERICTASAILDTDLECNDGTTEATAGDPVTYTTRTHLSCGTSCCKLEYDVCSKSEFVEGGPPLI